MRKSRILTFLFALWPGAGQMYLGYMKRGVSLMGLFFLIFAIMGFLGLSFLAFLLPIIWFYAFFDTMNLRSMSYDSSRRTISCSIWIRQRARNWLNFSSAVTCWPVCC